MWWVYCLHPLWRGWIYILLSNAEDISHWITNFAKPDSSYWHSGFAYTVSSDNSMVSLIKKIHTLDLYSQSNKRSYCKILWSLEAVRLDMIMTLSLWRLAGISAEELVKFQRDWRSKHKFYGFETWDTRSCSKTPIHLMNRGPGVPLWVKNLIDIFSLQYLILSTFVIALCFSSSHHFTILTSWWCFQHDFVDWKYLYMFMFVLVPFLHKSLNQWIHVAW